jgi:hypothetical protein
MIRAFGAHCHFRTCIETAKFRIYPPLFWQPGHAQALN